MRTVAYAAICVIVSIGVFGGVASASVSHPISYAAALATHPLGSDTSLSDPDWARGRITQDDVPFEDITTRARAACGTTAYLLYDAQNLYVGFDVQQPNLPITATQTTNDVGFGLDDFVGIGIDTSGNGATVYYFTTTPRGTRYEEASESTRYQPVWHAAASRDDSAAGAAHQRRGGADVAFQLRARRCGGGRPLYLGLRRDDAGRIDAPVAEFR